ncbi:vacuolar ATP synthase proteolipid subunit [Xylogone sp. PMI_703]|nr:vacuolar ATP synthase proteolipid subunit [Xylogone sp. PMI_703]
MDLDRCPVYASFFGTMGCSVSIVLCCMGAAYGTAKSSIGISAVSVLRPDMLIRNLMPVILCGVLGMFGLVISVLIASNLHERSALHTNFLYLGAGMAVGLCGLSAGFSIGIIGDAGVRGTAQQPRMFAGMVLILIFAEVLALYGLIVALLLITQATINVTQCV